jgi:acyl-coenzyme A thioesterase PaaI-like protein
MLIGNPALPALHGGTIAALLESSAIFELLADSELANLPKIINITVTYLRSGRPLDTYAKSVITKHGRRVAAVHVEAWQEDRSAPIATALAHFLLEPAEQGRSPAPE